MSYELKTKVSDDDVESFITSIENPQKKDDCLILLDIFHQVSWYKAKIWWKNILGFGSYHYKYTSGCEWDWMRTWFAPRAAWISIYIMPGYEFDTMQHLMDKLWKYKHGKSCLNIKKLSDINLKVLEEIIKLGLEDMKKKYPE